MEWDVDKIRKMIQEKIESHVKRPEDTVRHAYKLFGGRKGITKKVFRESLCRLGLDLPRSDLDTIFQKFDVDGSGVLDFQGKSLLLLFVCGGGCVWSRCRCRRRHRSTSPLLYAFG